MVQIARYPDAVWHRCPGSEPSIRPTQFIFHTAVMRDLDALQQYFCGGGSGGIESHFGVGGKWGSSLAEDGEVRQWRDTEEQADANRSANRRPDGTGAISCETTDNAPRLPADIEPWTPKQVPSLIRLGLWGRAKHGIPPRICRSPDDPGYGWHAMWDNTRFELSDGSTPWTPSAGKVCPGPRRIAQLKAVIFPAIFAGQAPEEDDMPYTDWPTADRQALVDDIWRQLTRGEKIDGTTPDHLVAASLADPQEGLHRKIDLLWRGTTPGTSDSHDSTSIEGAITRLDDLEGKIDLLLAALPAPPPTP